MHCRAQTFHPSERSSRNIGQEFGGGLDHILSQLFHSLHVSFSFIFGSEEITPSSVLFSLFFFKETFSVS